MKLKIEVVKKGQNYVHVVIKRPQGRTAHFFFQRSKKGSSIFKKDHFVTHMALCRVFFPQITVSLVICSPEFLNNLLNSTSTQVTLVYLGPLILIRLVIYNPKFIDRSLQDPNSICNRRLGSLIRDLFKHCRLIVSLESSFEFIHGHLLILALFCLFCILYVKLPSSKTNFTPHGGVIWVKAIYLQQGLNMGHA